MIQVVRWQCSPWHRLLYSRCPTMNLNLTRIELLVTHCLDCDRRCSLYPQKRSSDSSHACPISYLYSLAQLFLKYWYGYLSAVAYGINRLYTHVILYSSQKPMDASFHPAAPCSIRHSTISWRRCCNASCNGVLLPLLSSASIIAPCFSSRRVPSTVPWEGIQSSFPHQQEE